MKAFTSFNAWWQFTKTGAATFIKGVYFLCASVVMGAASIIRAVWLRMTRWVGNYPSIALGFFIVAALAIWLGTFTLMRARAVGAEEQRDSISYLYTSFKEQHGYE